jgi:hypothetical protein
MSFPTTLDNLSTSMNGTTQLSDATLDHSLMHRNLGTAVNSIESFLGTNSGTNVFSGYTAGQQPLPINSGTLGTTIAKGTINNSVLGTPSVISGTIGTAFFQGGTLGGTITNNANINGGTYGTLINFGGISLKDNGSITQTGTVDHITLTPGASKFVRQQVYRQDNVGTNTFQSNQAIQTGWGYILIPTGGSTGLGTITYGTPFLNIPIPAPTLIGIKLTTGPSAISDFTSSIVNNGLLQAWGADTLGSANFKVSMRVNGAVGADTYFGISWFAMGSI